MLHKVNHTSSIADYKITPQPEKTQLFINHQLHHRSGHLGHAMCQLANGELIAFYPNCSVDNPQRHGYEGHSAIGWMEYKRSVDEGRRWSEPYSLDFSRQAIVNRAGHAIFAEKAVVTDAGTLVLFNLVSDISRDALWEPYLVPVVARSTDNAVTWHQPVNIGTERGRVYDAIYFRHAIYALKFCNDAELDFRGNRDEHIYQLYISKDDGLTFSVLSTPPFDTRGRGYGTLCALSDGRLIAYIYDRNDESLLDYSVSADGGVTWCPPAKAYFARRLRNPQMIAFGRGYFMHGRSGSHGNESEKGHFVLYYSEDGIHWDGGTILARREHGQGAYSNSMVVASRIPGQPPRLRIHASHAYERDKTNILAWWIDEIADDTPRAE